MSEPNEPNDTDFLADLLRAERERDELPEDRVDDAWNALDERLRALPPPPPPAALGLPTAAKVLGVLAVFGAGVLTGTWLERSRAPERDVVQAPVPSASTVSVASSDTSAAVLPKAAPSLVPVEVTSLPLVSARPVVSTSAAPSVASAAPSVAPSSVASSSTDLADERSLVEGARVALLRGRPSDALGLATNHANRFPRGELAEDRDFIRVRALRDLGRGEEARAEARAFLARYPKSGLRSAVAAIAE